MAANEENPLNPKIEEAEEVEDDNEEEDEDEDEDYEEEEEEEPEETPSSTRSKLQTLFRRLSTGTVSIRVHDVVVKGNAQTKESLFEAEALDALSGRRPRCRSSSGRRALPTSASSGSGSSRASPSRSTPPPELPGTADVVIEVVEPKNPLTGDFGVYTKPEARAWSLEGSLKLKDSFGYGDIWDVSGAYGWDQTSELSAGLSLPRFKAIPTPLTARVSLLTQDWLKFSSYKERLLGISLGFLSSKHHNLAYNLTWRNLSDPSHVLQVKKEAVRVQSSLLYKIHFQG